MPKKSTKPPAQHGQSLFSAGQEREVGKHTESSTRWLNQENSIAQKDLWNFVSDELKMKVPENARIREQKVKFLKNKSYLHDVTLRAEPYMYWIVGQIKQRKMPMELVLLPIVESAFDPHATSHKNAAGLWQIVPSTGRNYGLIQDQWYDGRRDVFASTVAVLDLMQRLNRMFDGDWLLTIAAFNSGEGRVLQAMKANQREGKPTDFWSLSLPQETLVYVPKMLALSEIIKNQKRYGVALPKSDSTRALAKVEIGQQMMLTQAAEMAGMSLTKLKSYNAGYKRGVTSPNGPHYITLPKGHAEQLKGSLADGEIARVKSDVVLHSYVKTLESQQRYKVRSGDTIERLAKRFHIKPSELTKLNDLQSVHHYPKLKVGQMLNVANNPAKGRGSRNGAQSITYNVRKGDSLVSIAQRHRVKLDDVMRWNSRLVKNHNLQPGVKLTLFVNKDSAPES